MANGYDSETSGPHITYHASPLPVQRPIIRTGPEVRAHRLIRPKLGPGTGTEDRLLGHIVHVDRDTQHGAERHQLAADVAEVFFVGDEAWAELGVREGLHADEVGDVFRLADGERDVDGERVV